MFFLGHLIYLAALSFSLTDAAATTVYDRPLAFVFARNNDVAAVPYTQNQLLARFDQVTNGLTSVVPFFLNVPNASSKYASFIQALNSRGTVIVPAVGGPTSVPLNDPKFKAIARDYRNFSDYIRLEDLQGYYEIPGGPAQIQDMINYVTRTLKFNHVMLNPWPRPPGGGGAVVRYTNPQIDASFEEITLNFSRTTYQVTPDPENWKPNYVKVGEIRDYKPNVPILINYENPPQELALNRTEVENHNSKGAMAITINGCKANRLHWSPPLSMNYDAIALGTWPFIARQLSQFQ